MTMVPTASEVVEKIVCYSLLHSQIIPSITVKKVGYWDTSGVSKNIAEVAQAKEQ